MNYERRASWEGAVVLKSLLVPRCSSSVGLLVLRCGSTAESIGSKLRQFCRVYWFGGAVVLQSLLVLSRGSSAESIGSEVRQFCRVYWFFESHPAH
jgi:hypothetical protein